MVPPRLAVCMGSEPKMPELWTEVEELRWRDAFPVAVETQLSEAGTTPRQQM